MGNELIQTLQTIVSLTTVVAVVLTWRQLRLVRKQATTTFEDRLTEQYRKIMEDIPTCIWLGSELKALGEEHRDRCRDAIYRYIDLSNEEAFLHSKGRVTDDAWIEWRKGIRTNMKLPAFVEVWAQVREKSPGFEELRAVLWTSASTSSEGTPQAMKMAAGAGHDAASRDVNPAHRRAD
jgi:hypothetical protein